VARATLRAPEALQANGEWDSIRYVRLVAKRIRLWPSSHLLLLDAVAASPTANETGVVQNGSEPTGVGCAHPPSR
jgi:hypothetical protein